MIKLGRFGWWSLVVLAKWQGRSPFIGRCIGLLVAGRRHLQVKPSSQRGVRRSFARVDAGRSAPVLYVTRLEFLLPWHRSLA